VADQIADASAALGVPVGVQLGDRVVADQPGAEECVIRSRTAWPTSEIGCGTSAEGVARSGSE
jgi:hypothetical protein